MDGERARRTRAPVEALLDALADLDRRDPARPRGRGLGCGRAVVDRCCASPRSRAGRCSPTRSRTCGCRAPIATYDPLLRVPGFADGHRPDVVLRIGGPPPTSRSCSGSTPSVDQVLVDPDGAWLDPQHAASGRMVADPELLLGALADAVDVTSRRGVGARVDRAGRTRRGAAIDGLDRRLGRAVRRTHRSRRRAPRHPTAASLVVASSMPVRDVESFAAPRDGVDVLANRGVNGIDGFVSTALGVAAVADGPDGRRCSATSASCTTATACSVPSTAASTPRSSCVDNGGGGIFSFLPQAELPEHFETLFGTPHGIDLGALGRGARHPGHRGRRRRRARAGGAAAVDTGGVRVVRVRTDRATNVTRHRDVWAAVADAVV